MSLQARVLSQQAIGDRYMALRLHAPGIAATAQPGQFVMLTAARTGETTPALPRPMAIYSIDGDTIEILYGTVGDGTKRLSTFRPDEEMYVVGPLGRSFEVGDHVRSVLLVGRGIGTCSLTTVAQSHAATDVDIIAVTSARDRRDLIGGDFYRSHRARAVYEVTDEDGTSDPEALFTRLTQDWDVLAPELLLTCGSQRLTRLCERLATRWGSAVQVSVEAHMACGLGYCHGCASGARSEGEESPLICKDGPAFLWRPETRAELGRSGG